MRDNSQEYLNSQAMQIILLSGNARTLLNQVIDDTLENDSIDEDNLKEAHKQLIEAHKIQTQIIQNNMNNAETLTSLLFTHAQDTLMTINSEFHTVKNMLKLYKKLRSYDHE